MKDTKELDKSMALLAHSQGILDKITAQATPAPTETAPPAPTDV